MAVGKPTRWPVLLSLALIFVVGAGRNVHAQAVDGETFFEYCPGTITVEENTQVEGITNVPGSCTIHVINGAILEFVNLELNVQGDLVIEGDADQLVMDHSRISADGSIDVSITGDVLVLNVRFASEDISFDAAEVVRVDRGNFNQVNGPITISGGVRCVVDNNKPGDIGCTLDPTPQCPCFDTNSLVSEVNAFLDSVAGGHLNECESPSIYATSAGAEELEIGSTQLDDSAYVCFVVTAQYALQILEPPDERPLTDEEIGACQLAIEYACEQLSR